MAQHKPVNDSAGCPFCGKKAAIDTLNYRYGKPVLFRVQCLECKAATGWYGTEDEAWEAWNRRVSGETNRESGGTNLVLNKGSFILHGLCYSRNRLTGNCSSQKEFRGKLVRIKEDVYLAAYEECKKIIAKGGKP